MNMEQIKNILKSMKKKPVRREKAGRKRYLEKSIKKLERALTHKSTDPKGSAKYYHSLEKLAKKLDVNIDLYPELSNYLQILKLNKKIRYKHLSGELHEYMSEIKAIIPYSLYRTLSEQLKLNEDQYTFYNSLFKISKEGVKR